MKRRAIPILTAIQVARFWSKVDVQRENRCWLWRGYTNDEGRGMYRIGNAMFYAPRVAFYIVNGRDPLTKGILHDCDQPGCCNPFHLWVGTQGDNVRDMIDKGRKHAAFGERHGMSKITEAVARRIKFSKRPQLEDAKRFGVSQSLVSGIRRGTHWRHLCST